MAFKEFDGELDAVPEGSFKPFEGELDNAAPYGNEGYKKPFKGSDVNQIPTEVGANLAPTPYQEPSLGQKVLGTLEQVPSLGSSIFAQIQAPVSAAVKMGLGMNTEPTYEKQTAADIARSTYEPRTQSGQEQAEAVGEFMNRYVMPFAGVHGAPAITPKEGMTAFRARLPERKAPTVQGGVDALIAKKTAVAPGEQIPLFPEAEGGMNVKPAEAGAGPALPEARGGLANKRQMGLPMETEALPEYSVTREGVALAPDDQASLFARNAQQDALIAQLEQERLARQPKPMETINVAPSGEAAPGLTQRGVVEDPAITAVARERAARMQAEALEQQRLAAESQRMGAAEQTSLRPTENQMDLFGDNVTQGPIPDTGLGRIESPVRPQGGPPPGPGGGFAPRGVNATLEALEQSKALTEADRVFLRQLMDESQAKVEKALNERDLDTVRTNRDLQSRAADLLNKSPVEPISTAPKVEIVKTPEGFVAMQNGRQVGKLEVTAGMTPEQAKQIGEAASVDIVSVDPSVRGTGVGRALYQAFNQAYEGNIRPSGKTTADAWKVWKRDFPEKVDQFVAEEAQRIKKGAPADTVIGNITDSSIAEKVQAATYEPGSQAWRARGNRQRGFILIPGRNKRAVDATPFLQKMRNIIPEQLSVPEFIAKFANAKDVVQNAAQRAANQLTKGGIYMSERLDNPLYTRTVNEFLEAEGRAKAAYNQFVNEDYAPKLRALNKREFTDTWAALKKMEKAGVRATESELLQAGLSQKQVAAIESHWNLVDTIFPKINETMRSLGLSEIDPQAAYVASKAKGAFRTLVFKGDKVVGIVGSDSRRGMQKDLAKYLESNPEYKAGPELNFTGGKRQLSAGMEDTLNWLASNDPDIKAFLEASKDVMDEAMFKYRGAKTHTMAKKGIEGMPGNKPWESAEVNAREGFEAQLQYAKRMFEWAEKAKANDTVKQLIVSPELNMPVAKEMARQYADAALGKNPTEVGRGVDNLLAAAMSQSGGNTRYLGGLGRGARNFVYAKFLKLDLGYLLTNLAQPLAAMPEVNAFLNSRGASGSLVPALIKALDVRDPINQGALKYARENHVYAPDLVGHSDSVRRGAGHVWETITNYPAAKVEQATRQAMFLTMVRKLHESGVKPEQGLYAGAARLTDMAMANYSRSEMPRIYQHAGELGQMPYTLSTYKHNELSRLALMAREIGQNKNAKPLLTALAAQVGKAGLMGTVMYKEAEWLIEKITGMMGEPFNLTKFLLDNADKKLVGPVSVRDVSYGLPGLVNADFTGRMGMGELIPSGANVLMPGADAIVQAGKSGYELATDPSKYNAMKAVVDILPGGRHMEGFFFDKDTGRGTTMGLNRNKVTATVERTPGESMMKKFGITSVNESKTKALTYQNQKQDMFYKDKVDDAIQSMKENLYTLDPNKETLDRKYVDKYFKYSDNIDTATDRLNAMIDQWAIDQNVPVDKRDAMKVMASPNKMMRRFK